MKYRLAAAIAVVLTCWNSAVNADTLPTEQETIAWLNASLGSAHFELCSPTEEKREWTTKLSFSTEGAFLIIDLARQQVRNGVDRTTHRMFRVDRKLIAADQTVVTDDSEEINTCSAEKGTMLAILQCQTEGCVLEGTDKRSLMSLRWGKITSKESATAALQHILRLGGAKKSLF